MNLVQLLSRTMVAEHDTSGVATRDGRMAEPEKGRGVAFLALLTLSAAIGTLGVLLPAAVILLPLPSTTARAAYRRVTRLVAAGWFTFASALIEKVARVQIITSGSGCGPAPSSERVAVMICNHHCRVDWLYLWTIACRLRCAGKLKIALREDMKKAPLFGWAMQVRRARWPTSPLAAAPARRAARLLTRSSRPRARSRFPGRDHAAAGPPVRSFGASSRALAFESHVFISPHPSMARSIHPSRPPIPPPAGLPVHLPGAQQPRARPRAHRRHAHLPGADHQLAHPPPHLPGRRARDCALRARRALASSQLGAREHAKAGSD